MIRNSDRFLTAFNRIDHAMRDIIGAKDFVPFYRLIEQARKKNAFVRKFEDDLRVYADLRNAIIHHRTSPEFVIAEPHTSIVEKIEKIDQALAKPIKVGQLFHKRVFILQTTDSFRYTLKIIKKHKYTQFPVYNGHKFQGLVTTVGITNWLATVINDRTPIHMNSSLEEILQHEKNHKNYKFINRNMTIYEAEEIFKQGVERGQRFEALLITEQGRQNEKLIGMITPLDIVKIE